MIIHVYSPPFTFLVEGCVTSLLAMLTLNYPSYISWGMNVSLVVKPTPSTTSTEKVGIQYLSSCGHQRMANSMSFSTVCPSNTSAGHPTRAQGARHQVQEAGHLVQGAWHTLQGAGHPVHGAGHPVQEELDTRRKEPWTQREELDTHARNQTPCDRSRIPGARSQAPGTRSQTPSARSWTPWARDQTPRTINSVSRITRPLWTVLKNDSYI